MSDRGRKGRQRRGAMAVLIAVLMVVFVTTVAFSLDVAYMQLVRTQLRTSTDAAARAGGEALAREQATTAARQAAKDLAEVNLVAGAPLLLDDDDIVFGNSSPQSDDVWVFTANASPTNALRVYGRRTEGSLSGSVGLFFARIFGIGDFEPVQTATVVRFDRDICLVIDRSTSMKWEIDSDSYPDDLDRCDLAHPTDSRWAALVTAVEGFNSELAATPQDEYVGLVSFGSDWEVCDIENVSVETNQTLTADTDLINTGMDEISARVFNGGTNIEAGIEAAVDVLTGPADTRPFARKCMIVFTDGHANQGGSPVTAAQAAADEQILIHTVTFSDGADQTAMKDVAAAGGGEHYHAPDAAALEQAFREIALSMLVVLTE